LPDERSLNNGIFLSRPFALCPLTSPTLMLGRRLNGLIKTYAYQPLAEAGVTKPIINFIVI